MSISRFVFNIIFDSFFASYSIVWFIQAISQGDSFFAALFMTFTLIMLVALLMNALTATKEGLV